MYRLLLPLLFLCLAQAEEPPDRIHEQALAQHHSADLEGAIRGYRAYLKVRPGAVEIRSNLGAALAGAGHYEDAIGENRRALEKDRSNPGVLLNLGLAYYKAGQFTQAVHQFSVVHALQPENQQATMLLADCHLRLGEDPDVIALLTPLESSNPNDLAIAYMLGTALIRDKRPERGQVIIDRILKNGDSAEARLLLGTTKMMVSDFAGAVADLERAVKLNAALPDVYSYYGMALMHTGDTAGAADAFRKELAANPNDFSANLEFGALLRQDQEFEQALRYLDRALRLRPGDPGARFQIASAHFAQGKIDQARSELEQLVKDSPQFPEAHVTLATIYYRLKRKADADRERAIVQKLTAERQAKEPGARAAESPDNAKNVP
jgi:tetratricopeptide (TPR) repeat protein